MKSEVTAQDNPNELTETRILRVLLVEDEVLVRMDLADTLRDDGWVVVEAGTVDQALLALKSQDHFDVLLTDVHMPGTLTGLDLARIVRQSAPWVRVVIMSGNHTPESSEELFFHAFLAKPVLNIALALRKRVDSEDEQARSA